jgi:hypothetical protein
MRKARESLDSDQMTLKLRSRRLEEEMANCNWNDRNASLDLDRWTGSKGGDNCPDDHVGRLVL